MRPNSIGPSVADEVRASPRPPRAGPWLGMGIRRSRAWTRFYRHAGARAGAAFLVCFFLTGLLAPWVTPHDPTLVDVTKRLQPPSAQHWLGTDHLGRDLLARIVYGARVSMVVGAASVGLGAALGVPLGAAAGYRGGWIDQMVTSLIDFLLSFPPLLLAILVVAIFGPGLTNAMLAIGIAQVPVFTRLMRAEFVRVRESSFVEAARALGASDLRILAKHILPNALAPIVVQATLGLASAILSASYLSFLGLGAQPPTPEWGAMIADGRQYLRIAPHASVFPGLAIMMTVLAFNLFGDGLRDAFDPRSSRHTVGG